VGTTDALGHTLGCSAIRWWPQRFLDRLLHHSHALTIRGDSYRLREKRRSGLLQKAPARRPAGRTTFENHRRE
jgi:hypothetical protein